MFVLSKIGLIVERDLKLAWRRTFHGLTPVFFFLIVVSFFPLALAIDKTQLPLLAPGILWMAVLLAVLLSLQGIFQGDFEDGSLQQILLAPRSLTLFVYEKLLAHWLLSSLPLLILLPLLAQLYYLPSEMIKILAISLSLGTPILCCIGALGSALTLGIRSSGLLAALVILPLYVPILIFGTNSVIANMQGLNYRGQLAWLAALLIANLTGLPWIIGWVLRMGVKI